MVLVDTKLSSSSSWLTSKGRGFHSQQQRRPTSQSGWPSSRVILVIIGSVGGVVLLVIILLALLATSTTGTTTATFLALPLLPRTMTTAPPPPPSVFSLLVTLQFTADEPLRQFLVDIAPLCQHVRDHEPDTIAYQVLHSDIDPLRVLILERYRDKENAFLKVHRHSIPFLEFRPKLQAMQEAGYVTVQGNSYLDSGTEVGGFGDRVVDTAAP